jgi:hypothetical protein
VLDGAVDFAESAAHTIFFFCYDSFHEFSPLLREWKREHMTIRSGLFGCFCAEVGAFVGCLFSKFRVVSAMV